MKINTMNSLLKIPLNSRTLSISIILVNVVISAWYFTKGKTDPDSDIKKMIMINRQNVNNTYGEYYKLRKSLDRELVSGRFEKAMEICQEGMVKAPDDLELIVTLGQIYSKQGKYKEAFNELEKALKVYPDNAWLLHAYGNLYVGGKDYDRAMECFNKALKVNIGKKEKISVYNDMALLYLTKGDKENAGKCKEIAAVLLSEKKNPNSGFKSVGDGRIIVK